MVEPAYASSPYGRAPPDLMVEHLKVMAASRACLRILNSRACLRILRLRAPLPVLSLPVEHLKVLDAYWVVGIGMSE